jgi:hypothetical protein
MVKAHDAGVKYGATVMVWAAFSGEKGRIGLQTRLRSIIVSGA